MRFITGQPTHLSNWLKERQADRRAAYPPQTQEEFDRWWSEEMRNYDAVDFEELNRPEATPPESVAWRSPWLWQQPGACQTNLCLGADQRLYLGDRKGIRALDSADGRILAEFPAADLKGLALHDGSLLAFCSDRFVSLDLQTWTPRWEQALERHQVRNFTIAPDGQLFYCEPGKLRCLGTRGETDWSAPLELSDAFMVGYSAGSGAVAVQGRRDGRARVEGFLGPGPARWSETFAPWGPPAMASSGPLFLGKEKPFRLFGSEHVLEALDPATGKRLWRQDVDEGVKFWATSSGDLLLGYGHSTSLALLDGQTGNVRWSLAEPDSQARVLRHPEWVRDAVLSADRVYREPEARPRGFDNLSNVTVTEGRILLACLDGAVHCLDLETGKTLWSGRSTEKLWGVTSLGGAVDPDGRVFMQTQTGTICLHPEAPFAPAARLVHETPGSITLGGTRLPKRGSTLGQSTSGKLVK